MKKTKNTQLVTQTKSKGDKQEVLQGEVVSGENIERGSGTLKFNDEVQITDGFYKHKTGKVIGRKKIFIGDKMIFSYSVLLDSIDLVEVFEKELKVLSE